MARIKPVIRSIKHYFHLPVAVATSGATLVTTLINTVAEGAARAAAIDVDEGTNVSAIYLEFWISGVTLDKTATWCVVKRVSNVASPTFTEMANLGSYANKKNIFNVGQGIPPSNGNVMNIYKGWFKIPKGKQRWGLGDKLVLVVAGVGTNVNVCGITTFKEFT